MGNHTAREASDIDLSALSGEKSLVMAMSEPSFYPRKPSGVRHTETHISHLFFVGDLVYKIKKPVRFSFLDYSTLRHRRYFLHEELRLNRRLAPSVYLGVLPVSYGIDGWRLGSYANPVEYTLVMRRLPERRMLDFLLDRNQVTPEMMRSLAETVAPFHTQGAAGGDVQAQGHPASIRRLWDENLADIRPFVGKGLDCETFEAVRDFGESFIERQQEPLMRRVREGRIRDVHGDLHCEHICFAPEGIQIFDCIEFNPQLRYCDLASEIAFLIMDMEFRGGGELANEFLGRYLELMEDPDLTSLLPFYKCYRALVRGKVAALRANVISPLASSYFDYARRVPWEEFKPFLILICGLTGSGKSTLARELSQRLGMHVVRSDATRKALLVALDRRETVPYEEGIYAPPVTERTYAEMAEKAEALLAKGEGAILDATFQRKKYRRMFLDLAAQHGVPLVVIFCHSSPDLAQERLRTRAEEGRDLSDGSWEIYLTQRTAFELEQEVPEERYLSLDTEAPPEQLAHRVERFLRSLLKNRS